MRDAQAAIAAIVEDYATKPVASITSTSANGVELEGKTGDGKPLRLGEQVIIKRLGKLPATIVEIPQAENDYLTVQAGTMKMRVKLNEIVSRVTSSDKEGARIPSVKVKVSYIFSLLTLIRSHQGHGLDLILLVSCHFFVLRCCVLQSPIKA